MLKLALIQAHSELCSDHSSFYNKVETLTLKALNNGAEFLVWPEDITFWLLFFKKRYSLVRFYEEEFYKSIEYQDKNICNFLQQTQQFLFKYINLNFIGDILKSKRIIHEYNNVFSSIAKKYKCYILAGTIYEQHLDGLYNVAHVFDNKGKLICEQKKIYPLEIEKSWGVISGKKLEYFNIKDIKIAIQICNDINFKNLSEECKKNKVDLIISPSAGYVPTYLWQYNFDEYIGIIKKLRDEFNINYGRVFQCGSINKLIKFRGMSSLATIDNKFLYNEKALIKRETIIYGDIYQCPH